MDVDTLHKVIVGVVFAAVAAIIWALQILQKVQLWGPLISVISWIRKKWKQLHEKDGKSPSSSMTFDDSSVGKQGNTYAAGRDQKIDQSTRISVKVGLSEQEIEHLRRRLLSHSNQGKRALNRQGKKRESARRTNRPKTSSNEPAEEPASESLITGTPDNSNDIKSVPNEEARTSSISAVSGDTLQPQLRVEWGPEDEPTLTDGVRELALIPSDPYTPDNSATSVEPSHPLESPDSHDDSVLQSPIIGSALIIGDGDNTEDIDAPPSPIASSSTAEDSSASEDTTISIDWNKQEETTHEASDNHPQIVPEISISGPSNDVQSGHQSSQLTEDDVLANLLASTSPQRVGVELQRRRISLGISQVDVNYDRGWVDQMETGYWSAFALSRPRHVELLKRYLRTIGWTFNDLQDHLEDKQVNGN